MIGQESAIPLTVSDLTAYFFAGVNPQKKIAVGVELEKIGLLRAGWKPVPITGPQSIQTLFRELVRQRGWSPVTEGDLMLALKRDQHEVSLEPGGQLEFSSMQHAFIDHAQITESEHLKEIRSITDAWGVVWTGLGIHPTASIDEVQWLPKERYKIMRERFLSTGSLGHWMMKMTASVQVTVDYLSEEDAAKKSTVAARLVPIWTAMFANSCLHGGKLSGYKSFRSHIWQHTDPLRCGLPACFFKQDFRFRDYVDYALDAPMFFIRRNQKFIPTAMTFRQFMREGLEGWGASLADWDLHLNCLFPEIRLRRYIEIRSCDRLGSALTLTPASLIKFLLYDPGALSALEHFMEWATHADAVEAMRSAAKDGMDGMYGPYRISELAAETVSIARMGLVQMHGEGKASLFERTCLDSLEQMTVKEKISPADITIRDFQKGVGLDKIIESNVLS